MWVRSLSSQLKKALSLIDEADIVELLKELVRIPSRNPPGEEKACSAFIADRLRGWGFDVQLIPEPFPDRPQVVAYLRGSGGKPRLILNGHIDTVPEGEMARWSFPPFEGLVKDGRMYGRGACDMKSGITAAAVAAKALRDAGAQLNGDLILQFAVGEECGEPGTKHLLLDSGIVGDYGIVLEPTQLRIATAQRGLAWLEIMVSGRAAHAGTPYMGVNAVSKAVMAVEALERYHKRLGRKRHKLLGTPTCTVTKMAGGIKENVVPSSCHVVVDRRIIPGESVSGVQSEVRETLSKIAKKDREFKFEVRQIGGFSAAEVQRDSPLVKTLEENLKAVAGVKPKIWGTPFGSDVRNFVNDAKIPAVTFGPGNIENAHCFDEYVEISEVVKCAKVLVGTAMDLLA